MGQVGGTGFRSVSLDGSRLLFVWDAAVLEGNPFTFPEVRTLLDGVTIGGRRIADQEQVLNLAESSRRLLAMVRTGQFELMSKCGSATLLIPLGGRTT